MCRREVHFGGRSSAGGCTTFLTFVVTGGAVGAGVRRVFINYVLYRSTSPGYVHGWKAEDSKDLYAVAKGPASGFHASTVLKLHTSEYVAAPHKSSDRQTPT